MLYNKVSEEKIKQQAAVLWNHPKLYNDLNMLNFAAQSCSESLKHEAEITIKQLYRKYSLF